MADSFLSSAKLISALTFTSRCFGLIRDIICLRFFGTAVWHYFALPFIIPNLFRRLFGEGALAAALIPVYTEKLKQDPNGAKLLARSVVTILISTLTVLTLLGLTLIFLCLHFLTLNDKTILTLQLAAVMLPYLILICAVAAVGALLNVHRHFAAPAAAPILLNLVIIAVVLFFRDLFGTDPFQQIYGVAFAVLIAGFLQLAIHLPPLHRAGLSIKPAFAFGDPHFKKFLTLMLAMMLGLSVVQFNVLLDSVIAFSLSASDQSGDTFQFLGRAVAYPLKEGSLSYLYLAQRLYQLPLAVFGIALATAVFPLLTRYAVANDRESYSRTLAHSLRLTLWIAIPATVGLIIIARPLIQLLFEQGFDSRFMPEDTTQTAWTLIGYTVGLIAYCLQQIIIRAFYAFQDAKTPVKIAMGMVIVNLILNLSLIWHFATAGLALATALTASGQVFILTLILIKRKLLVLTQDLTATLTKTLIAATVMAVACLLTRSWLTDAAPLIQVTLILTAGLGTFLTACLILKNKIPLTPET